MIRTSLHTLTFLCALAPTLAAETVALKDYLPAGVRYDPGLPKPAEVIGHEVGEWHVRHDQLVRYFEVLAEASDRMTVQDYGRTHEGRRLLLAAVSTPQNLEKLEEIRERHLAALDAESEPAGTDRPVIVWMGYSVHGNEASGSNASLLVAYHLAAAMDIDELLANTVILIDPSINPDGLSRFAQWANSHRGRKLVADPDHREHREVWPGGRTNHYWFDLNRDWLLLTHPESRGRLRLFHRWKPNVVTDFHEMGTSRTFFFQPGIPSRQNPNTPGKNLELTRKIAAFHARILDEAGSLYYTEESFDDFYYGKGSTYADVNGGIGILFEQASSRGHVQESSFGPLSFPFTIKNQFLTSLSTLRAAAEIRGELLEYQMEFYLGSSELAERDPVRAYVFDDGGDAARTHHFIDILLRHQIEVRRLAAEFTQDGRIYRPERSYIVVAAQSQYRLLRSLFEKRTEFADHAFYDVSTWTLPLSFGLPYAEVSLEGFERALLGERVETSKLREGRRFSSSRPYAYVFGWEGYFAPRAAFRLLEGEVRIRVATRPFTAETDAGAVSFDYGAIVVPAGGQDVAFEDIRKILALAALEDGVDVYAVKTGLTSEGVDLGSPSILPVERPVPLLVVGTGVSAYEAGEVWHLLDERFGMTTAMIDASRLESADLKRYTHIVMVSGSYEAISKSVREKLSSWVRAGGVVVAVRGSVPWVERHILGREPTESKEAEDEKEGEAEKKGAPAGFAYADYERLRAEGLISGVILETSIDRTHPLGFGYAGPTLPVFRKSKTILEEEEDPFATVLRYTEKPLLSGYISAKNLDSLRGRPAACATRLGAGTVVRLGDNPNFRGVWYGTNKIFLNALFFGKIIKKTGPLED